MKVLGTYGFVIGEIIIPYYGFFVACGIVCALLVGVLQTKINKQVPEDFIIIFSMAGIFAFLGAKILYLIVSYKYIDFNRLNDWKYINSIMASGFVFYGGLLGTIFAMPVVKRIFHINVEEYINTCFPVFCILHGFGRLGCNAVGCCYGKEYHGIIAKIYTHSLIAPNNVSLFPVQLLEAIWEFALFVLLMFLIDKKKIKNTNSLVVFLLLYTPFRFILEFMRADDKRGFLWIMSTSQWISAFIFIGTIIYTLIRIIKTHKVNRLALKI